DLVLGEAAVRTSHAALILTSCGRRTSGGWRLFCAVGGGAEVEAPHAREDEAEGDDGKIGDDEHHGATGSGGFEGDIEEGVERGGQHRDLGKPADDGELEDGASDAGGRE